MSIDLIKRLGIFVVLVLVQGLVFNHIHLFNCATPLLYILMVLHFRRNHPRWSVMLWSFMMGLCIDVFANTPGVAAASMTFIGLLQPYLFELFVPRDSADDLEPSMRTIPTGTAYAVWTGIGAVLTVLWAIATGAEQANILKVVFLAGIIACVVGLKFVDGKTSRPDPAAPAAD